MENLSDEKIVEILNKSFRDNKSPSVTKLNGSIIDFNRLNQSLSMSFKLDNSFCNGKIGSKQQIQGGFLAAIIDSVCAHAVLTYSKLAQTVATLEQKCTFIRPVSPDIDLVATAYILKFGKSIAFLRAELRSITDDENMEKLFVDATQTCALVNIIRKGKNVSSKKSNL